MSNILQIGFTTEGTTDIRFLKNIIWKTFQEIAFECSTDIEVYEPEVLYRTGDTFNEQIVNLTINYKYFDVICVHRDSDSPTMDDTYNYLINPSFLLVENHVGDNCKNLIPIIPVQMSEAWMLANRELLKEKIGTNMSNAALGLPNRTNQIETITDPKELIINAIRLAKAGSTRRQRSSLSISDLYSPISQELEIHDLERLNSFVHFKDGIRNALIKLNYLT